MIVWEDATFAGFPLNTPAPGKLLRLEKSEPIVFRHGRELLKTASISPATVSRNACSAYAVTANFFPLFGVQPLLGRSFLPEEDRPGANKVAVLSYSLWQVAYGGDRNILNREIFLNGEKHSVVGVMPASFQFFEREVRLWVPIAFDPEDMANRGGHYLKVVARLKPGVA